MASRFVALPVGQGDAFLYERENRRALVDGGKSSKRLLGLLSDENVKHIDVLVCTHNDKDHSEGIAGLLEGDSVEVGEVWLPGRWSQRIVDLFGSNDEFLSELAEGMRDSPASDLEAAGEEPPAEARQQEPGELSNLPMESSEAAFLAALDAADDPPELPWHWPWFPRQFDPKRWELWIECLAAANRIRRIAKAARDAGAKIRWFDFDDFSKAMKATGGISDFLVPVNAVEITPRLVKARISAFDYLRLSVANRESLVFHAPATPQDADILFSADSDLAFPLPTLKAPLVTAPHHGSDANSGAYVAVQNVAGAVTWIRSDGRFQSRPGSSYLAQVSAYCTRCRGSTGPGQSVRADDQAGTTGTSWKMAANVQPCHCN